MPAWRLDERGQLGEHRSPHNYARPHPVRGFPWTITLYNKENKP